MTNMTLNSDNLRKVLDYNNIKSCKVQLGDLIMLKFDIDSKHCKCFLAPQSNLSSCINLYIKFVNEVDDTHLEFKSIEDFANYIG